MSPWSLPIIHTETEPVIGVWEQFQVAAGGEPVAVDTPGPSETGPVRAVYSGPERTLPGWATAGRSITWARGGDDRVASIPGGPVGAGGV